MLLLQILQKTNLPYKSYMFFEDQLRNINFDGISVVSTSQVRASFMKKIKKIRGWVILQWHNVHTKFF